MNLEHVLGLVQLLHSFRQTYTCMRTCMHVSQSNHGDVNVHGNGNLCKFSSSNTALEKRPNKISKWNKKELSYVSLFCQWN